MNFLLAKYLLKELGESRNKILSTTAVAGLSQGMVMLVINDAIKDFETVSVVNFLVFLGVVSVFTVSRRISLYETQVSIQAAMARRQLSIISKLRDSSLTDYEHIGKMEVMNNISENTQVIFEATRSLVYAMTSSIMLVFSFFYIAFLSPTAFWICIGIIAIGVYIYNTNQGRINELYQAQLAKENQFLSVLNHFLDGFKEVKLNRKKSDDLYEKEFQGNINESLEIKNVSEKLVAANMTFAQTIFFFLIGAIVFLLPMMDNSKPDVLMSVTAIVLFITGGVGIIVESIPLQMKADIALNKILGLETRLREKTEPAQVEIGYFPEKFKQLEVKDLCFHYFSEDHNETFGIGPIDLKVKRGDLVFLVGGNGSGKTTLLKTLTSLYASDNGSIEIDGLRVSESHYYAHRNLFSMVLTDFHLFEKVYGLDNLDEKTVNRLLAKMQVENKTSYVSDRFTNLDLSTGQRKRIALIVALLESKPILIFDEVAADQDPEFREYFYRTILPELKAEGKTIFVVSHDDRYFDIADTLIKLEYGKIASIEYSD